MNSHSQAKDLQSAAAGVVDAVSDMSETAGHEAKKFIQNAADTVKSARDYARDNGSEVGSQIKDYLKANPSHALLGAAAVGFLLGRLMSRD